MKIGTCLSRDQMVKGYSRWGDKAYEIIKKHGFDCVDYGMLTDSHIIYTGTEEEINAYLLKEKTLATAAGITIAQTHGPWKWPPENATEKEREVWLWKMQQALRATAILGCKYCVIHPIMPLGLWEVNTPDAEKTWQLNLEFMRELVKTARECDVTICLENMPMLDFSMSKPEVIAKFIDEINDEHFQMCFDTGHVCVFEDLSVADELRKVGDKVKVLHVHDNAGRRDEHLFPYSGKINWVDFAKAVKDIHFNGVFSLETSPSPIFPDEIFEEMGTALAKIANFIINE